MNQNFENKVTCIPWEGNLNNGFFHRFSKPYLFILWPVGNGKLYETFSSLFLSLSSCQQRDDDSEQSTAHYFCTILPETVAYMMDNNVVIIDGWLFIVLLIVAIKNKK